MKKVILALGVLLCVPLLSVLVNLYWWTFTDVWVLGALTQEKILSAFIFAGISIPVFAIPGHMR
jgi:hypothetical protein